MALVRVDEVGVGEYDANQTIQAEDYFKASGIVKKEKKDGGFSIGNVDNGDFLVFNNVKGLQDKTKIQLNISAVKECKIELRKDSPSGELIWMVDFKLSREKHLTTFTSSLPKLDSTENICFVFKGSEEKLLEIDSFSFKIFNDKQ